MFSNANMVDKRQKGVMPHDMAIKEAAVCCSVLHPNVVGAPRLLLLLWGVFLLRTRCSQPSWISVCLWARWWPKVVA